jgi:hypothetical protein
MNSSRDSNAGFTLVKTVILLVVLVALGFLSHFVSHSIFKPSENSAMTNVVSGAATSPSASYAVLTPATVPSKTPECSQQLTYASNGSPSPVSCSNGYLNMLAWNALSALELKVMTLGYSATPSQVQSALCVDANAADADSKASASNAIEESAYQISAIYYGWSFATNPSVVLSNGVC